MSVAFFFGTRPEIIKLAPIIRLLGGDAHLIHTGQHFDFELSGLIAGDLGVTVPPDTLNIGASSRASQIGRALVQGEKALGSVKAVVVQGDTNSALAGGLAANAMGLPLFHVEAGLRSYDRRMPEEHNRVLIDHLADMCWAPTDTNVSNLLAEGIPEERLLLTGNPIVEALAAVIPAEADTVKYLESHGVKRREFALVTLHRPENVDEPDRLASLLKGLSSLPVPVVFPIHPRTSATVASSRLESLLDAIRVIPPIGYREFLALMASASVVISDSGGVQEEVSILKVPLVVVRRSTERPEVLGTFARLTEEPEAMAEYARDAISRGGGIFEELADLPSPYGDGRASHRIVESLREWIRS